MGSTQSTWGVWQARQKKKEQARESQKSRMCVRYTLLIANSLLALLGILLLAGGVWRIVDDESLREVAKDIQGTQEWDDVKGGDRVGGCSQGGVHPQVLQLCPLGNGRNHPPCGSLWLLWSQKRKPVPPLPLQHLCLHHPSPPDRCYRLHQR